MLSDAEIKQFLKRIFRFFSTHRKSANNHAPSPRRRRRTMFGYILDQQIPLM